MITTHRVAAALALVTVGLAAHASAQRVGPPAEGMRRGTLTAHWTASSVKQGDRWTERSTELLDATVVFDVLEMGLMHQLQMAREAQLGPDGVVTMASGAQGVILPNGKLVSATGKVSYSGDYRSNAGCNEMGAALFAVSGETKAEASATWQADAGFFAVQFAPDGRVRSVTINHPLRVTTKRTSPCPKSPPSTETKERTIKGGFTMPLQSGADSGWVIDVHETPAGYAGSARYHQKGVGMLDAQEEVTKAFSFTLDLGGPLRLTGPAPMAAGGQPPVQPPGPSGPPGAAMVAPGMTPVSKGEAVFVQGGKEARWQLASGGLMAMGGVLVATLTYTPPGGGGGENTLALVVGSQGGPPAVTGLNLRGGPAGDAEYDQDSRGCALQLDRSAPARGIAGTITCTKGFDGVPITKLTFRATP